MEDDAPALTTTISCPHCHDVKLGEGELRMCPECHGMWIPVETLAERVAKMQARPHPHFEWAVADREGLPCAICLRAMEPLRLFDVPVDRCDAHGVWFEKGDLVKVLHRSGDQAKAEGLDGAGWHAAEVALEAGDLAVGTAHVAVEVASSGILEGILDAIGDIFSSIDL